MAKTDISIRELVNKVNRNEIALPEMQRRYVWTATRVRDLLDSLYRGYPSGTILVWETDRQIQTQEMAVSPTNTPTTSTKLLLLDGQQRITSLTAVIEGKPVKVRNRKRPIDILFNLEHPDDVAEIDEVNDDSPGASEPEEDEADEYDLQEELKNRTFVVASGALAGIKTWVPVSEIFKKTESQIVKGIGLNSDDPNWDKYVQRLAKVKAIENYQYVMHRLERDLTYEEVTEIFVRVNSLGIKLRGTDLALAQITSQWTGFLKEIEAFANTFGKDGEYMLEVGLFVRMLVIFATNQCRFKTVSRLPLQRLKAAWEDAKNGLNFAVNFVRSNANIDNLELIGSPFLLCPIAVYSKAKKEKLSPEEVKQLLKWFYLAHLRGHYGMGSSESLLDSDLAVLAKKADLGDLLIHLKNHVRDFEVSPSDLAGKGARSPLFSMLYFVLRDKGAADWVTGLKLSSGHQGKRHSIQYHHIFPKSILKEMEREKKEINEIANFAFIGGKTNRAITNKNPKDYLPEIQSKQGESALTNQLVPMDQAVWDFAKYPDFLAARRSLIAAEINAFMRKF